MEGGEVESEGGEKEEDGKIQAPSSAGHDLSSV
jgi:hypothetical protein